MVALGANPWGDPLFIVDQNQYIAMQHNNFIK